jgi:hypothetical protein
MSGIDPAGLRAEAERGLARAQGLGETNGKFAQALRAALGLLEGHLPAPAALATFDTDTCQALLTLAETLAIQGAVSAPLLTSARQAFSPPKKAGKRFREWVAAHKGMEPHALREALDIDITNTEATEGKHAKYWCRLSTLKMLLAGRPVDLVGYGLKAIASFKTVADAQIAQGGLSPDALEQIDQAAQNRDKLVTYLKTAKLPKPK